ncbi:phosphatidylserine/phosphatidylglycerophosphate/cardiolipin synthase family protein [Sphingomonas changnyeongensis]|uniref:Phospholipase D n=1 Tax=Sphingomonas changnyeongensis TaxID=2698679 RepID=A0A7Z2NYE7_9SPHN|nr:phosphatidylserine/phosphatidylglycerophosphate/cardiolipin synthase family protein [Sphingomonas changnyeongensis]
MGADRLRLVSSGPDRLAALLDLIAGAQHSLRLLYYIFAPDDTGTQVRDALVAAAARGVRVRLLLDGFGSAADDPFLAPLSDAGAEICRFIPRLGRRYLLRNHQKLALADEAVAIIGGFNIEESYFAEGDPDGWRDLGLIVDGPAAARLTGYYDMVFAWSGQPRPRMRALRRALFGWSEREGPVRWLLGGPTIRMSPWAAQLRADLGAATRLRLIAAYFAPAPTWLRRIERVARRGSAHLLTAGRSDNGTTIAAARFTYPGLLRRGARIHEYDRQRLHTKLYVIDDIVHIGSANLDMRSLFLNMELMLRIEDAALSRQLSAYFEGECAAARQWRLADLAGWRHWPGRIRHALAYFLVAVVDYTVSRRLNFGGSLNVDSK